MKTRKNRIREKARKNLFNSESAGATVVAAVLLLSIIFTVLAVVRVEYVPAWKTDAEQSHMSEVQNDMAELKSTVDMISLFTSSELNSSEYGFPVTISFSMGGGEIPILEPSKSSGTLSLNTECCRMTIIPEKSSISTSPQIVDCGGITYYSNNREYLNQAFRYENGALILSQKGRSLMRQFPSFNIKQTDEDNYTVSINAIKITGEPDSISSNTDASLRLTGLYAVPIYDSNDSEGIDSFTCTILTGYPDAWISYLNETSKNAGLEYGTDYALDKIGSDTVYFSFLPGSNKTLERLCISKSVIEAELGTGGSLKEGEVDGSESGEDEDGSEEEDEPEEELTHGNSIILNKPGIGGVISSGTYIQFKNNGNNGNNNYYWIKIDGSEKKLKKNDIVKLVIDGDQTSGTADMNTNQITNFNFNVKMYIDGEYVDQGKVTGIYVKDYSDYESTLTYLLPSYLSGTQFQVDGVNLIGWWPENDSAINLYNIGIPTDDNILRIEFNSGSTYFDCSADYEIVSS
ncbi:TPA: hypothetical protein HA338_11460 [Methanosarcina acetivorans]|uniref:Archaeal Type IV pilin N-terminal domain-containing protein n=2 Tax=Methanosarcina acetivorans TaxID=2214 RepID=Q8TU53_METAC|nr:hypothetical protein [Methanosarcina acetivorans]AAM03674.1 predicted protein [Methanosarcina acetivorans C2A]HIH94606.1 hypothetical protein [Methanosarcina acetivorans]